MFSKRLLTLVCAAAMLLSLFGGAAVSAGDIFTWREETTSVEAIIERDGYLEGVWFPWLNHVNLGHGLTSNELMVKYVGNAWASVGLDDFGPDKLYQQIYNLKAMGFNIMGYEGSIYGEGVVLDETGDVIGVKEEYLYNVRRFLNICREVGMPVLWTVCCHSTSVNDYYKLGKMAWDRMCRMYGDRQVADHYAQRFVAPLCDVLAEYPDVVVMVAATVEAENEINDSAIGNNFSGGRVIYGVNQDDMLYFIKQINDTVAQRLPGVTRTIGSQMGDMSIYRDIEFDMIGDQNYNYAGNSDDIAGFNSPVPMFVSEFGLGFESKYDDDTFARLQLIFRDNFRRDGYKGWMMWCWSTDRDQPGSTFSWLRYPNTGVTDYRSTLYDVRGYVLDYRAAHRGETVALDTPVMLCNVGNGTVEWFAPRQQSRFDLQRSDDGGATWTTLVADGNTADYLQGEKLLKGIYRDPTPATDRTAYRVIARDADGHETVSAPSNEVAVKNGFSAVYVGDPAPAYDWGDMPFNLPNVSASNPLRLTELGVNANRPVEGANLITNESFEKSVGGQWNTDTFLSDRVTVVTDPTAPEGDKSVYFDTTDTAAGEWHSFSVEVEPNTDYIFSVWVKGDYLAADNQGYASVGVMDPATDRFIPHTSNSPFFTQDKQIVPTAWDDEWHLRSVMFNSGNRTSVKVGLFGCRSRMWIDGLALYVNGMGIRYNSENMQGLMHLSFYGVDTDACLSKDSVTLNPTMEEDSSDYWQSGSGWKSGFMSLAESKYGYGTSMKYTATENPLGLCYIKWVDVKPDTDYIFAVDMKVLEEGAGNLVLLDGKLQNINPQLTVDFSKEVYGDDWFRMALSVNTGVFTTIGIGVVDKGGSALLDNIRLYEADKGAAVKDLYTYTNKVTNNVAYGKTASVTARAEGDGLKYAWYYKNKGASKFTKTTSVTGKTYSVAMDKSRDGRQVYCVITDKYGVSRKTATTTLTVKKSTPKITTQPQTATYAKYGETAKVTVKASGDGLKYQWYIKNDGATKYSKSSVTSSTYSVKMSDTAHGRRLYCVITDAWGKKLQTKTVQVRMAATITTQPKTVTVKKNATAKLTVKAKGEGLKYTWYVKNAGSKKYSKSSVTKSTYSVKMTSKVNGRYVYCVVTDKYGKKVQSKTVRVKMK